MTSPSQAIGATALVEASAEEPTPVGVGSGRGQRLRAGAGNWLGLLPFFAFIGLFLIVPTVAVFSRAFGKAGPETDRLAMTQAMSGTFRKYFWESIKLGVTTALIGGLIGIMLALVIVRMQRPRWLRTVVSAFSGVAANMGGIILAFMFIASLGAQGLETKLLKTVGITLQGTWITSFWGLVTVYLFFQIPLMFLVMLPAADGLKPAWREAVSNLGGTAVTYWRRVGIPVLTPAALGGFLLLFANSFAAYATAQNLTTKAASLVPIQIRVYLQGNVMASNPNLGYALAAWMILIMLATIALYLLLRRRAERWQR